MAYRGTLEKNVKGIAGEGLSLGKGKRFALVFLKTHIHKNDAFCFFKTCYIMYYIFLAEIIMFDEKTMKSEQ